LSDIAREKLIELVGRFGSGLCDDARRCEALLRDVCAQEKREIFVLVSAARERVGADLLNSSAGIPAEVLFARLTKRLHENLGLAEDLARWGVETWALALGVGDGANAQLTLECPKCNARVNIATRLVGQKIGCPNCQASLRVPDHRPASGIEEVGGPPVTTVPPDYSNYAMSGQATIRTISAASSTEKDDVLSEFPRVASEEMFRHAVRRALEDGIVTDQERAEVNKLRRDLAIDSDVAARIVSEVKTEPQAIASKVSSDQSCARDPQALGALPLLPALRDDAKVSWAANEIPLKDDYLAGATVDGDFDQRVIARASPTNPPFERTANHDDEKPTAEGINTVAEKSVRDAAYHALSTGFITEAQRRRLNKLCKDMGLSANVARRIVADVKKELEFDPDLPFDCPRCGARGRMPYGWRRPVQCPDCHASWDTQFAPVAPDRAGSRAGTAPLITPAVVPQPSVFLSKGIQVQLTVVAWAMVISGVWGGLFSGAFFVASLFRFFDSNLGPGVGSLLLLLLNIAICRGGFNLKTRKRLRPVVVGIVAGLVPINVFCFFLTTPLAIWGLVLLCRKDIRRDFQAEGFIWRPGSKGVKSSVRSLPHVEDDDAIEITLSE
jgi:hypothetical protein